MTRTPADEPAFEVVWPSGRRAADVTGLTERPPDLDGRTVAFVWDHVFKGEEMFAAVESAVRTDYRDVTFVPHEVFGNVHGSASEEHDAVDRLPQRLREHGVDVAVVGVGA